jgi:hypothetical protein
MIRTNCLHDPRRIPEHGETFIRQYQIPESDFESVDLCRREISS